MNRRLFVLLLSAALAAVCATAGIPSAPNPPRLVNDFAGIFDSYQNARLEEMLTAFDDSTSNQITVVTVSDLEGYEAAEYATRIGLSWGVGSKDFNNGIVVLVKPKTRRSAGEVSIQVGYGLEGAIPDAYAKRIIENEMIPNFIEEDYYRGVLGACEQLMALASGEISEPRGPDTEDDIWIIIAFLIIFALGIAVIVIKYKDDGSGNGGKSGGGRHIYMGPGGFFESGSSGSSRWDGGGFGGLGGFGGFGGGSFGGGGASGRW